MHQQQQVKRGFALVHEFAYKDGMRAFSFTNRREPQQKSTWLFPLRTANLWQSSKTAS